MKTKRLNSRPAMNKRTIANLDDCFMHHVAGYGGATLSEGPRCLTKEGPICFSEAPFCLPMDKS